LWAGRAALYLGELDAARTLYERGADQARLSGAVGMLAIVLDRLAWTDAIALADRRQRRRMPRRD
jgi:hypothetical protein